jgi:hypothetical protein
MCHAIHIHAGYILTAGIYIPPDLTGHKNVTAEGKIFSLYDSGNADNSSY